MIFPFPDLPSLGDDDSILHYCSSSLQEMTFCFLGGVKEREEERIWISLISEIWEVSCDQ